MTEKTIAVSQEFTDWLRTDGPLDVSAFVDELHRAKKLGLTDRTFDRYDEEATIAIWREYKNRSTRDPQTDGVPFAFNEQIERTRQILTREKTCGMLSISALYTPTPTPSVRGNFQTFSSMLSIEALPLAN